MTDNQNPIEPVKDEPVKMKAKPRAQAAVRRSRWTQGEPHDPVDRKGHGPFKRLSE